MKTDCMNATNRTLRAVRGTGLLAGPVGIRTVAMLIVAVLLCVGAGDIARGSNGTAAHEAALNILVLNSYHPGYDWGESVMRGIRETLSGFEKPHTVRYEYMDTKHYPVSTLVASLVAQYRLKYSSIRFDVIIAADNNALDFLLRYRDELFPRAPVVFCGINGFTPELLAGHRGFTGVAEDSDLRGTLELALQLHPGTRHIAVVSGISTSSMINSRRVRALMPEFTDRVDFIDLSARNVDDLVQALRKLPEKTVILYMSYYMMPDGTTLTVAESTSLIARVAGLPMYSAWEYTLGNGVIGGRMLSGEEQGRQAAEIAERILRGQSPDAIPVLRQAEQPCVFDYAMLRKFGIPDSRLPENSLIRNEPQTFYYRYKRVVWAVSIFVVYQFVIILFLLRIIARRKKAEESLKREEARLEALLEISRLQDAPVDTIMRFALHKAVELTRSSFGYLVQVRESHRVEAYVLENDRIVHHNILVEGPENLPRSWAEGLRQDAALTVNEPGKQGWQDEDWPGITVPVENFLILPVVDSGVVTGLAIVGNSPTRFSPADQRQLTLLVEGMLRPIQNKRAEERQQHLEEELRQAQKMEAIGTFAGGIAHDFNNILGSISTCSELALADLDPAEPAHEDLTHIQQAALRGKNLIARILAFSRKSDPTSQPVQLESVIRECLALLHSFFPPTVAIRFEQRTDSALVLADPTQLHQVVMNLCTNAEQAMRGQRGVLTLELDALVLNEEDSSTYAGLPCGRYARVSVTDTGCGISPEVLPRIFDPFFTTRKKSGGTGLGLSMSHGIIKRHGGIILVESMPGAGTTFRVLLPCAHGDTVVPPRADDSLLREGSERILLADDDVHVRYSVAKLLRRSGYRVHSVADGSEALQVLLEQPGQFAVVLTDYMMPVVNGLELAAEIVTLAPKTRVILYSGYEDEAVSHKSEQELAAMHVHAFLPKPFSGEELCRVVRTVLDAQSPGGREKPWQTF